MADFLHEFKISGSSLQSCIFYKSCNKVNINIEIYSYIFSPKCAVLIRFVHLNIYIIKYRKLDTLCVKFPCVRIQK